MRQIPDLHALANAPMSVTAEALRPFMLPELGHCDYCGADDVPVDQTEHDDNACDDCMGEPE